MKPVPVMLGVYAAVWPLLPAPCAAQKISDGVVRIGVMNDLSGPYAYAGGPYSVYAAQMAIDDFGGKVLGKPIELLSIDHQNKPDIASNKAREWFDKDKVDILGEVAASATSLAAIKIAKEKNKIVLLSGPAATRITNEDCTPITAHWTYDTYALAAGTGRAVVKDGEILGSSLPLTTLALLEKDTADMVKASGARCWPGASSFPQRRLPLPAASPGFRCESDRTRQRRHRCHQCHQQASEFGMPQTAHRRPLISISGSHLGLKGNPGDLHYRGFLLGFE